MQLFDLEQIYANPYGEKWQRVFSFTVITEALLVLWGFSITPYCAHIHSAELQHSKQYRRGIRAKHGRSRRHCATINRDNQANVWSVYFLLSLEVAQPLR